jgi:undecaprenyl-diphosphatase
MDRLPGRCLKIFITQLLLLFCFCDHSNAQFGNLDKSTLRELTEDRTEGHTEVYLALSHTDNYICMAVPVGLLATGFITHDADMKKNALYVGESILVSTVFTTAIKDIVKRPRPFVNDPTIVPADAAGSYSFPSGHTSEAFATATALSIAYPKWYVIAPSFLWATSVGYSRMYLGVHYPTDILGGALTGAGSAWLTYKANKWLKGKKHTAPAPEL